MSAKITKIGVTNDKISARGGLALFLRYVEGTGLYAMVSGKLSPLVPQGGKGLRLQEFVKQMLAFFIDGAAKREGCEPTYKRKKGFQPLHICWGPFLIDIMFRKGSAHSNHGTDYTDRVRSVVELIRKRYSPEVPIVLCADSGFADQKAYREFEGLGIHFITTGKLYGDVKAYVGEIPKEDFDELEKNGSVWGYVEFGGRLKSWDRFRRSIFTRLQRDATGQFVMDFGKPDNIIYTNIGNCPKADQRLRAAAGGERY